MLFTVRSPGGAGGAVVGLTCNVVGFNGLGTLGQPVDTTFNAWAVGSAFSQNVVLFSCHNQHCLWTDPAGQWWGMGSSTSGELGLVQTDNPDPVLIDNTYTWRQIWAGWAATFGIRSDRTMWVMGAGSDGKLGTGNTTSLSVLTQSGVATDWDFVCSGNNFSSYAVKTGGTLYRCGFGNGSPGGGTLTWTQVGVATDWLNASFCICQKGVLIIKSNGTMWYYANTGQYAAGNAELNTNHTSPVQVGTDTDWLLCGGASSGFTGAGQEGAVHALKTTRTMWATGEGSNYALGTGATTDVQTWTQIGSDADWADVKDGGHSTLALKQNGSVWHTGTLVPAGGSINSHTFSEQTTVGVCSQIANGTYVAFALK